MKFFLTIPFFSVPYRQVYFLQLENYHLGRFLALVPRSYSLSALRQELVWTPKLIAVVNIALVLQVVSASVAGIFLATSVVWALLFALCFLLLSLLVHFFFLALAVVLLAPVDYLARRRIVSAAVAKLKQYPQVKIIAIAGSYGKTTMKEALASVLAEKFVVLATAGNINTPVGIARTVLQKLDAKTQVFVVEMGEHYRGDLAYLTKLFPPDVTVVTGIAEAHLERFGTFEKLVRTIFEAVEGTKKEGLVVLNADDAHVTEHFKKYLGGREAVFFNSKKSLRSFYDVHAEQFREDGSGISFMLTRDGKDVGEFSTSLIAAYAVGVAVAALIVGERLGLSVDEVRRGLAKLVSAPHRLQVVPSSNGVLVIDDSYNGNPEGVRYAIEALGHFKNRRKVYITPGLVEGGEKAEAIHREIGRLLAGTADVVVLIQNSVTPFIADELEKSGFPKTDIRWFASAVEAHAAVPDIVKTGDVVVFQNDWPDNYV